MPESEDTVWLTQEAFDKLTQELEYLKGCLLYTSPSPRD